jgi:hypothetical protein
VDLQIRIEGGAVDDYVALADWLNGNRDFRGPSRGLGHCLLFSV